MDVNAPGVEPRTFGAETIADLTHCAPLTDMHSNFGGDLYLY